MTAVAAPVLPEEASKSVERRSHSRRQIRGSSMLFAGRLMAMVINFGVHVLIVRYLSMADYGAFAYAMSLVSLGCSVCDFGLHRAVSRLVPIYHEERANSKLAGTITLAVAAIVFLGLLGAALVFLLQGFIGRTLIDDPKAVRLLLVLVFMSPLEAFDRLLINLFAIFASARAIFFRRYVLGPLLKVLVVLLLIGGQAGVTFLAAGYLAATAVGVAIYLAVLVRLLKREGLTSHFGRAIEIPWREILTFTLPLLSTDLLHILNHGMDALLLGYFSGAESVAELRSVRPTAVLNEIVFTSFAILYTPQAARLFARKDAAALNHLYWQSATWIAILTLPVFLLTFALAKPLTMLLFGARYESAGVLLSILSLGYYIQAAFGFNGTTLTIYRQVRYVAVTNLAIAAVSFLLSLLLIPRYGALGAAIATCATLVLHNVMKQIGLLFFTDVRTFDRRYVRVYAIVAAGAVSMLALQWLSNLSIYLSVVIAGALSLTTLWLNRDLLDVEETFPELLRLPGMPRLLGRTA